MTSFELDVELSGEQERLRLELFRDEAEPTAFRLRLWRSTFVQTLLAVPEEGPDAQVNEWQTMEDFGELLDAKDTEFQAGSVAEAERHALERLKARLGEAAWAKGLG